MLELEGLSTAAKVGKLLIFIAIIIGIFSALVILMIGTFAFGLDMTAPRLLVAFLVPLGVIKVVGVVIGIYAYKSAANNAFHNAGILALVSSLLPPLDLIMLIGGISCLVSAEANR